MVSAETTNEIAPLDLSGLDPQSAAELARGLQQFSQEQLDRLYVCRDQLQEDEARQLESQPPAVPMHYVPLRLVPLLGGVNHAPANKLTLDQAIDMVRAGRESHGWFHECVALRLVQVLGANSRLALPDHLLALLVENAWLDPRFRRNIGAAIRRAINSRELVVHNTGYVPVLAPETFWLLVLVGEKQPRPPMLLQRTAEWYRAFFMPWGRRAAMEAPSSAALFDAEDRLAHLAEERFLACASTGYWDQKVAVRICQQWPNVVMRLESRVRARLFDLPMLKQDKTIERLRAAQRLGDAAEPVTPTAQRPGSLPRRAPRK